jgi:predicted nucleic acid-binding protein
MSSLVIFDTSIFIDHLRTNRHKDRIARVQGLIRTSAVVLAELWRGATQPAERAFLRALERNHPILSPTERMWVESGQLLGKIRAETGCAPGKLRDLHFDVLIALTARGHGARLITSNKSDFNSIRNYRDFALEIW